MLFAHFCPRPAKLICLMHLACLALPSALMSQDAKEPAIEIVVAVFGSGRGEIVCTDKIASLLQNRDAITVITTPGLGLKNPSGKFRDALRVWYRVDGKAPVGSDGKEAHLHIANGAQVKLGEAILTHWNSLSTVPNIDSPPMEEPEASPQTSDHLPAEPQAPPPVESVPKIEIAEFANTSKPFVASLATVQGLMIQRMEDGQQFGKSIDIIAQASPGGHHRPVAFHRTDGIGKEMVISLEEAERAVRARYPHWEERHIRISFGDKYSEKDGGSSGAAFALLIVALLEGIEIDPRLSVTGDILANWKVVGAGAVPEKIHAAILDGKALVAIPAENSESINDAVIAFSIDHAWRAQILSVPDLHSLIAFASTSRAGKLNEAIEEFSRLQVQFQENGESVLEDPATVLKLESIIAAAPNHESAKCLHAICKGNRPTRLSRGESLRQLGILIEPIGDVLWTEPGEDQEAVAVSRLQSLIKENRKFMNLYHEDVQPASEDFDRYLEALENLVASPNKRRRETFNRLRVEMVSQLEQISANREFMESLIRQ